MKLTKCILLLVHIGMASMCLADWTSEIGYAALQQRLGTGVPTGNGITVSHVEAPVNNNPPWIYLPDADNEEFEGKTIIPVSYGSSTPSGHATTVGRYYYGNDLSIAPGIDTINVYEANHWLGSGLLRHYNPRTPRLETQRLQNHSWIGTTNNNDTDAEILRRIDLVASRDGVVVAAGVNNGVSSALPKLLANAYNVLAVGLTSGNSSRGPTGIDAPGRVKPDIVVPLDLTSWATPVVAASAALLLETADADANLDYLRLPDKALLVKALLMGGATKNECAGWRKGFSTPSTDGTVPLDYRYGAGELNIDNSRRILTSGEQNAETSSDVGTTGWDYGSVADDAHQLYFLEIPEDHQADTLSILVTWYRRIATPPDFNGDGHVDRDDCDFFKTCSTGPTVGPPAPGCEGADLDGDNDVDQSDFGILQGCFSGPDTITDLACLGTMSPLTLTPLLANIDLHLYEADDYTIGFLIDESISGIDNLEHIYLENLPSGRYAIMVTSDIRLDYAITWDANISPTAP